jgi:hypothetical protein
MAIVITDVAGLQAMVSGEAYELGNDIVWNAPALEALENIILDGKGFKISGVMTSNSVMPERVAMFAKLETSTLKNIVFDGCTITQNNSYYYAICAAEAVQCSLLNISLINCSITVTTTVIPGSGGGIYSGMLCATGTGECVRCSTQGSITATQISSSWNHTCVLQGLGGSFNFTDCYSRVDLTAIYNTTLAEIRISGIGEAGSSTVGSVTNCFYNGDISAIGTAEERTFGICMDSNSVSVVSSYWKSGCGANNNGYWGSGGTGTETSDANMKLQATYSGWDFITIWGINPALNNGYPYLLAVGALSTIETLAAKNITPKSVIIGGEYVTWDDTHVEMGLQWRPKGSPHAWTTYWWAKSPYYIAWDLTFWYTMSGLGPLRSYEYRAFYKIDSTYYYGSILSFTCTRDPIIFTYPGTEYRTAKQALDDVTKIGVGRYYADAQGNFQYESRLRRLA